ncbi:MAG: hypothetical protein ACFFFH_05425 [Candidatus Thorarchaeota archaeon]
MVSVRSHEEVMFDKVASYLFKGSLSTARKEFSLHLFAEWSKSNLDIVLKAISFYDNQSHS